MKFFGFLRAMWIRMSQVESSLVITTEHKHNLQKNEFGTDFPVLEIISFKKYFLIILTYFLEKIF